MISKKLIPTQIGRSKISKGFSNYLANKWELWVDGNDPNNFSKIQKLWEVGCALATQGLFTINYAQMKNLMMCNLKQEAWDRMLSRNTWFLIAALYHL